jgi:hypothetical protein
MEEEVDRDSRENRKRSYDNAYDEEYDRGRVSHSCLWANVASSCIEEYERGSVSRGLWVNIPSSCIEEYDRGRVSHRCLWANIASSCIEECDKEGVCRCLWANRASSCICCTKAHLLSSVIPVPHVFTVLCIDCLIVIQTP